MAADTILDEPNKLRRSSDRAEAVIVALLSAAFLCAVAVAPFFGMLIYQVERGAHGEQALLDACELDGVGIVLRGDGRELASCRGVGDDMGEQQVSDQRIHFRRAALDLQMQVRALVRDVLDLLGRQAQQPVREIG